MDGLLLRVGIDSTRENGGWNAPCTKDRRFCYVPIPDLNSSGRGTSFDHTYDEFKPFVAAIGDGWPEHLAGTCHLDPDFAHLTYGDRGSRGARIRDTLSAGDFIVFWAGLRELPTNKRICSIIGLYWIAGIINASDIGPLDYHRNAHTRRIVSTGSDELVVLAHPEGSGRLRKHIQIGEARLSPRSSRAQQRVFPDLLKTWGGLCTQDGVPIKDGYIQRSGYPPIFNDPDRFSRWFSQQKPKFVHANNA